jgi:hypothetical protein
MISNEFLAMPPDYPSAKELYDLECIQSTLLLHMIPGHPYYDAAKVDEYQKALALAGDRMGVLRDEYRVERGGDETCRAGLTRGDNGFPVVDGRPKNGSPYIEGGWLRLVRN